MGIGGSRRDEEYRVTFTTDMATRLEGHAHKKDLFVSSLIREIVECWVIEEDRRTNGEVLAAGAASKAGPRVDTIENAREMLRDEIVKLNEGIEAMTDRKRGLTQRLRDAIHRAEEREKDD